ncbi:hypothetical protein PTTG_01878 [Puccinia triticina 1-1 BBBD Race 1]|uniref:FAR1 domain-containing protein n=1 Tax=Puccinia triticina (isolate 1-1 / race 1 (BBBD)) TaxID=630390 RepID=A0A180G9Y3_PUCT1|nr:hypothetical protein PTTG_01878 [Puccinia triticina 1-1 BBBD Race 1]
MVRFCQEWAKHHGYTIAKANSHANKNVYIRCNQYGEFCGSVLNRSGRKTALAKISCPFEVKRSVPTSKKVVNKYWSLTALNGSHNHDPSSAASSHTAHKKLLPEQFEEIRKLSKSNLKPAQILLQLQTSDNKTFATNKTVSNVLQKIHLEDLDGQSPTKSLLSILKESNWLYDVKVDSRGHVVNLFFAHPGSIHLAQINHHIALLDSTYKTNCYNLGLTIGRVRAAHGLARLSPRLNRAGRARQKPQILLSGPNPCPQ